MDNFTYKIVDQVDQYTNQITGQLIKKIDKTGNESWIPADPANADYIAYLEWQENQSS